MGPGPGGAGQCVQGVGIVAPVCNDVAALVIDAQVWCGPRIVRLSGGQRELPRKAILADQDYSWTLGISAPCCGI